MKQRVSIQLVEGKAAKVGTDHHMMPGLINPIVSAFDNPKKHLTTRGVAREMGVAETFVTTALLRDARNELRETRSLLQRIIGRTPANVREFQIIDDIRRSA